MSTSDNIHTLFFDLDGTLLGISDNKFEGIYTKLVTSYFVDKLDPDIFIQALWQGTEAMYKHEDPQIPVLESFFSEFSEITGLDRDTTYERFNSFYKGDFDQLSSACNPIPESKQIIKKAKTKGYKLVLATNPVFPEIATRKRCQWANLDYDDFLHVTHAENSNYCKPNPKYFTDLLKITDSRPSETLMIGNDYLFDMGASQVGIQTWLIDEYLGNVELKNKYNINYEGSLKEFLKFI